MLKKGTSIVAQAALIAAVAGLAANPASAATPGWTSAGHDLNNTRYQPDEKKISSKTVAGLQKKWEFSTTGDVNASPAVDGDFLYFPDSAGFLYKVNRLTGSLVWKKSVAGYTGIAGDYARATPVIVGNTLILGNQSGKFLGPNLGQPDPQAARAFAVDKVSGDLRWVTQLDANPMSLATHSPVADKGVVYFGVASNEELVAGFVPKAFWNFTFRGSVVALDARTGSIKWKTYTVPDGYSGGAVWGSTGVVDQERNQLYMATGNNYSVPQAVLDCLNGGGTPPACMDPANYHDSIIAMDLSTGAIRWAGRGLPYDAWNVGCGINIPGVFVLPPNDNCPNPSGPDWDFAQGPMLLVNRKDPSQTLVGAGQKSGMFWAFNASTGQLGWATQVAPGGLSGGLQWGSATDGTRIFVAVANSGLTGGGTTPGVWNLKSGGSTTAGGWAALNAVSGAVLWTTPDPSGSRAEAAVSAANDVVFGCDLSAQGTMYALNAVTGSPLWSFDTGGACNAAPSIADGMVYWGSGTFNGLGPRKVFGFGL